MHKARLFQAWGMALLLATASTTQAQNNTPVKLTLAFPKAGFTTLEVQRRYADYVLSLEKCAQVSFTNRMGISFSVAGPELLTDGEMLAALKEKRLDLSLLPLGLTVQASEQSLGHAYAVRGKVATGEHDQYHAQLIVRSNSPYLLPTDLIGKKLAHTSPSSFSGNLVSKALLPDLGLLPERNYEVAFSKSHERSIMGIHYGFWQGAVVASDQFDRMVANQEVKASDFRVLWRSNSFPVEAWFLGLRVAAPVAQRIQACTQKYRLPESAQKALNGMDGFVAVDFERSYKEARLVLRRTAVKVIGTPAPSASAAKPKI